ncbi:MAG TPA: hypothetical protein VFA65_00795 [Bryobacteraceae bacterium]|nr:hypothetical protein [Bryobacteraceae bacterium]
MATEPPLPPYKQSFWSTLPGIIAQVAGLIAAITALLTVLFSHCQHGPDGLPTATSSPTGSAAKLTTVLSTQHSEETGSCEQEAGSRSIEGLTKTSFTITNRTKRTLAIYWLNYQGHRQKYLEIAPNEKQEISTFLTHPWLVTDSTGKCMGIVYAPADVVLE